jgi:hypothetical protein
MGLDSISAGEVFQKSYFDRIPVVARSQPEKDYAYEHAAAAPEVAKESEKIPSRSQAVAALFAGVPFPRQRNESRKFRHIPVFPHLNPHIVMP